MFVVVGQICSADTDGAGDAPVTCIKAFCQAVRSVLIHQTIWFSQNNVAADDCVSEYLHTLVAAPERDFTCEYLNDQEMLLIVRDNG